MKKLLNLALVASLLMLMGCVKEIGQDINSVEESLRYSTLTAGFADSQTKTFAQEGKYLRWHADDRITAFFGNTLNRQYKFEGEDGDNSGSFSYVSSGMLETGNDIDRIYAVYPYNKGTKYVEGGKIHLSLPAVQEYAENSFGKGANTMVAVTASVEDTFLPFKNVCGYLKLKLKGAATVKSIEISGNSGEKIAGKAVVVPVKGTAPEVTMGTDASDCVVLECGEGVELSTTEVTDFWIALPETVFENGISVVVVTSDGSRYSKCTKNTIPVGRNEIQPMAALNVPEDFHAEGLNVIEYTSSEKEVLPAYDCFNSSVVSHTYDAASQKGVIVCEKPITAITGGIFKGSKLRNITFPAGLTSIHMDAFRQCSSLSCVYFKSPTSPALGAGANQFYINGATLPVIILVPADSYDKYRSQWPSLKVCPYDYEKGYPAIPDDEIWYFSGDNWRQDTRFDGTKFGSATIVSSEFDSSSKLGKVKFSSAVNYIYEKAFGKADFDAVILPGKVGTLSQSFLTSDTRLAFLPASLYSATRPFEECVNLQELVGKNVSSDGRCLVLKGVLSHFVKYGLEGAEYTIPEGVTKIAKHVLTGTGLSHLTLPNTLTSLEEASMTANKFETFLLPDSVENIGYMAFLNSTFTNITLGNGVKKISREAFSGCTITNFYCKATTPPAASLGSYSSWDLFGTSSSAHQNINIFVPVGYGPTYKLHEHWSKYKSSISEFKF